MPVRLLLADDPPSVLNGLERLFRMEKDLQVVGRCNRGEDVLPALLTLKPDILILDVQMPGHDGFAVLREIKTRAIPTRVVLRAAALSEEEMLEAIRLGVRGVVLKKMAPGLLVECVHSVRMGRRWLEKTLAGSGARRVARQQPEARERSPALTPREVEVVHLTTSGLHNREIAAKLSITEGTVKIHLHNVYEKLHLLGRLQLSVYARDRGLA